MNFTSSSILFSLAYSCVKRKMSKMWMCFFLTAWPECWICIENWDDYQHEQLLKWKFIGLEVVLTVLSVPAGAAHFLCANLCHIFNFSKMSCPICQVNFSAAILISDHKYSGSLIFCKMKEEKQKNNSLLLVIIMFMHSFRVDSNEEVLLISCSN